MRRNTTKTLAFQIDTEQDEYVTCLHPMMSVVWG